METPFPNITPSAARGAVLLKDPTQEGGVRWVSLGYGIVGATAAPPAPAVSLTTTTATLAVSTALSATLATTLSTVTLPVSSWDVFLTAVFYNNTTTSTILTPNLTMVAGTGVGTTAGPSITGASLGAVPGAGTFYATCSTRFVLTVTTAGTFLMQALAVSASLSALASNYTGMSCVRTA